MLEMIVGDLQCYGNNFSVILKWNESAAGGEGVGCIENYNRKRHWSQKDRKWS